MTAAHSMPDPAGASRRAHGGATESSPAAAVARMAAAVGIPAPRLLADLASLAAGPGRVSLADYDSLRLYDQTFWGEADRRAVVGRSRAMSIARSANFQRDWHAVAADRIVRDAYLAAHGLPTIPTLAVFREGLAAAGDRILRTREELRAYLAALGEPVIVAPAEGGAPTVLTGPRAPDAARAIDRLIEDVADRPGSSWILQPVLAAHPNVPRDEVGQPPLVRLLTLAGERGAKVVRGFWRLGGRQDVVASLDLKTGEARSVFAAAAPERARTPPAGLAAPDWERLKAVAVEGARVLSAFGLLGWDIAPGEAGPVIVGADPEPDLALLQLADRRGLLTAEFDAFLVERRRLSRDRQC